MKEMILTGLKSIDHQKNNRRKKIRGSPLLKSGKNPEKRRQMRERQDIRDSFK